VKIAVVGGGIFGCTAAIYAARAGHDVELFEKHDAILQCASGINQFRLHRGYHYPRSPETVKECQDGIVGFHKEYGPSVVSGERHIYAIARKDMGSHLSGREYRQFCDENNLPYRLFSLSPWLDPEMVDLAIVADEARMDPDILGNIVTAELQGVNVHLGTSAPVTLKQDCDFVVVAAYAGTNAVTTMLGCNPSIYQYEVCEKPIVKMPAKFPGIVVMDGEFGCVDPFTNGHYLLGHVRHAIHSRNIGTGPEVPAHLASYLNAGVVKPKETRVDEMVASGMEFIPALRNAEYVGSMFTVRAVLSGVDDTDARPTLVEELDDQVIRVFSGKIGTCVKAAEQVTAILDRKGGRQIAAA
jgi:hypothetical protein